MKHHQERFNSHMFITPATSKSDEYADSAIALAYMSYDEVAKWKNTRYLNRGEEYEDFKKRKAGLLIDQISRKFPGLKNSIENI